jgi:ABC-2 type transport system ATP-binding protein
MGVDADHDGIESRSVSKRYGSSRVLESVTFKAPKGELTLLAGRGEAGKTTWIRVALGMTEADEGEVRFASRAITEVRHRVALVCDEPPVHGGLDGYTNLRLLCGVRRSDARRRREVRRSLALDDALLTRRVRCYSLGQRRRLAIAAALLREPSYLFLDEPTVGLDPVAWEAVHTALVDLASRGAAILVTGTDLGEMESLVDRVAVLHRGSIVFEGEVEAFLRRRPPRVRVILDDATRLVSRLRRSATLGDDYTVDIICADDRDAVAAVGQIRALDVPFRTLSIVRDSLSEAFQAIHAEHEGAAGARDA